MTASVYMYRAFSYDVTAVLLKYQDEILFERYTNMAVNFFVVLTPRDRVKMLYSDNMLN